ncbi:hypothetical protein JTE90_023084 [Oedothorax gibbosus]|uniref:Uncharacterized protein n=1 Tax=Oedothorax gibbosus TaxID=931172 RepID=A0AAV6UYI8_9ARAC|nr:hypothetical protein JTE90_023084 [Oedothorax gibbosus]
MSCHWDDPVFDTTPRGLVIVCTWPAFYDGSKEKFVVLEYSISCDFQAVPKVPSQMSIDAGSLSKWYDLVSWCKFWFTFKCPGMGLPAHPMGKWFKRPA